jgi:hypothetical protein
MVQVTLQLPNELYEQARHWAAITRQDMNVALVDALAVALTPVHTMPAIDKPITSLSDEEVLAQTQLQMNPTQGNRLTHLLALQKSGEMTEEFHRELMALFQLYQRLWLRQSEALAEAVKRGLRPPLHA